MITWTLVEDNKMTYTPAAAGLDVKIKNEPKSFLKEWKCPLRLSIIFFPANVNGNEGGAVGDDQVSIIPFHGGRRKNQIQHS